MIAVLATFYRDVLEVLSLKFSSSIVHSALNLFFLPVEPRLTEALCLSCVVVSVILFIPGGVRSIGIAYFRTQGFYMCQKLHVREVRRITKLKDHTIFIKILHYGNGNLPIKVECTTWSTQTDFIIELSSFSQAIA